jgi:excisionase family DNA binding protein
MGERELLTIKQAAEDLGVSVMSVRRYIEAGRLTPYKPGRELFFWSDELDRFKASRRPPGRPKGSKKPPPAPAADAGG